MAEDLHLLNLSGTPTPTKTPTVARNSIKGMAKTFQITKSMRHKDNIKRNKPGIYINSNKHPRNSKSKPELLVSTKSIGSTEKGIFLDKLKGLMKFDKNSHFSNLDVGSDSDEEDIYSTKGPGHKKQISHISGRNLGVTGRTQSNKISNSPLGQVVTGKNLESKGIRATERPQERLQDRSQIPKSTGITPQIRLPKHDTYAQDRKFITHYKILDRNMYIINMGQQQNIIQEVKRRRTMYRTSGEGSFLLAEKARSKLGVENLRSEKICAGLQGVYSAYSKDRGSGGLGNWDPEGQGNPEGQGGDQGSQGNYRTSDSGDHIHHHTHTHHHQQHKLPEYGNLLVDRKYTRDLEINTDVRPDIMSSFSPDYDQDSREEALMTHHSTFEGLKPATTSNINSENKFLRINKHYGGLKFKMNQMAKGFTPLGQLSESRNLKSAGNLVTTRSKPGTAPVGVFNRLSLKFATPKQKVALKKRRIYVKYLDHMIDSCNNMIVEDHTKDYCGEIRRCVKEVDKVHKLLVPRKPFDPFESNDYKRACKAMKSKLKI